MSRLWYCTSVALVNAASRIRITALSGLTHVRISGRALYIEGTHVLSCHYSGEYSVNYLMVRVRRLPCIRSRSYLKATLAPRVVDPRTKGHVIASARTAFLLDVVCYNSNFSLAVLELSRTKSGWNISRTLRFSVFRRVCNTIIVGEMSRFCSVLLSIWSKASGTVFCRFLANSFINIISRWILKVMSLLLSNTQQNIE